MKKKLIVANWKLNGNINMISNYVNILKQHALQIHSTKSIIVIAPPTIYLERIYKAINNINIFIGAQNIDINLYGSFTGEVSILMLQDIGIKYVIVGHSERRLFHHENDDLIAQKFHLVKSANLIPILCVGETKEQKHNGQTQEVIEKQLNSIYKISGKFAFRNTVIAYEPIWAIGTGTSATSKYVQNIHKFIRNYIQNHDAISQNVTIQYGGSVNAINAKEFIQEPDIDGLLIGNAALDAEEFLTIIKNISHIH